MLQILQGHDRLKAGPTPATSPTWESELGPSALQAVREAEGVRQLLWGWEAEGRGGEAEELRLLQRAGEAGGC